MNLSVENLGPIRFGELSVSDLTIITGENNSGKTYLTHVLYAYLVSFAHEFQVLDNDYEISKETEWEIDLDNLSATLPRRLQEHLASFLDTLPSVLCAPDARFEKTAFLASPSILNYFDRAFKGGHVHRTPNDYQYRWYFEKLKGSNIVRVFLDNPGGYPDCRPISRHVLNRYLMQLYFGNVYPFIVSTERTGIATFQSELNLTRNRTLHGVEANGPRLFEELEDIVKNTYTLPTRHNIEMMDALDLFAGGRSFLTTGHADVLLALDDLLGGKLSKRRGVNALSFQPNLNPKLQLSIAESSSSVRSLLLLSFFLTSFAQRDSLIIIDEPELNLHPKNQRKLARLIVRLCNAGLRVFMTTHSDYMIREISNLIMLKGMGEEGIGLVEELGYEPAELIDASRVNLYELTRGKFAAPGEERKSKQIRVKIDKIDITPERGVSRSSFDDSIAQMNYVMDEIESARSL